VRLDDHLAEGQPHRRHPQRPGRSGGGDVSVPRLRRSRASGPTASLALPLTSPSPISSSTCAPWGNWSARRPPCRTSAGVLPAPPAQHHLAGGHQPLPQTAPFDPLSPAAARFCRICAHLFALIAPIIALPVNHCGLKPPNSPQNSSNPTRSWLHPHSWGVPDDPPPYLPLLLLESLRVPLL
jgi:hypothetical protein